MHNAQMVIVGCDDRVGQCCTDEQKLQKGVVFAHGGRVHFSGGQRKVPVPAEGLWRW